MVKNPIYYTWYSTSPYVEHGGRKTLTEARKACYRILTEKPHVRLTIATEILTPHPFRPNEYGSRHPGKDYGEMYVEKEGVIWRSKSTRKKYVLNRNGTLGRRI